MALAQRDLLPDDHVVDAGYVDSLRLIESAEAYHIDLVGPMPSDGTWQARAQEGFDQACFAVN